MTSNESSLVPLIELPGLGLPSDYLSPHALSMDLSAARLFQRTMKLLDSRHDVNYHILTVPYSFIPDSRLNGDIRILGPIHRFEGWRDFFRGLGLGLTGVVPATAIKFYTYGNCKCLVTETLQCDPNAVVASVISAATAGIVTATLVKTRLQLDRSRLETLNQEVVRSTFQPCFSINSLTGRFRPE